PQESGIGGWDPVVVVDIQRSQTADVDPELALLGEGVRKRIVETVDPLNDQNVPRSQRQCVSVILPDTLFKIVGGEFYGPSLQKEGHILIELLHIHGAQPLKI